MSLSCHMNWCCQMKPLLMQGDKSLQNIFSFMIKMDSAQFFRLFLFYKLWSSFLSFSIKYNIRWNCIGIYRISFRTEIMLGSMKMARRNISVIDVNLLGIIINILSYHKTIPLSKKPKSCEIFGDFDQIFVVSLTSIKMSYNLVNCIAAFSKKKNLSRNW